MEIVAKQRSVGRIQFMEGWRLRKPEVFRMPPKIPGKCIPPVIKWEKHKEE